MWASTSASLRLWAPRGADFIHFARMVFVFWSDFCWLWEAGGTDADCFCLLFVGCGAKWGPRPRPLCGCEPLVGQILLILLVVCLSFA